MACTDGTEHTRITDRKPFLVFQLFRGPCLVYTCYTPHPLARSMAHTSAVEGIWHMYPLPREYGTCETVKARLWPWLSGRGPYSLWSCPLSFKRRIAPPHNPTAALAHNPGPTTRFVKSYFKMYVVKMCFQYTWLKCLQGEEPIPPTAEHDRSGPHRALPNQTNVESGTSQSKNATSVNLSSSGFHVG